jgi:hypothetical protein
VQIHNEYYKQNEGVAMDAPTSAIIAETFIQYVEHTKIIEVLKKHHITDYYRYVDDILIIYNMHTTNIDNTLADFNTLHPHIQFTMEKETGNKLNYLDLPIKNEQNHLTFDTYRKPTTTDLIIHNDLCHPHKHKKSAIKFLINRMNKYPVIQGSKPKERQIISTILKNNNYSQQVMKPKQKRTSKTNKTQKTKLATFTYHGNDIRTITKLFRNTNIKVAYKTTNIIKNQLKPKTPQNDIYNQSGIYQLSCNDCPLKYIGQPGQTFRTRYKEQCNKSK